MLLAIDSRSTVLADLSPAGLNHAALTAYGYQSGYRSIDSSLGFNGQKREQQTGWYHLGNGRRVYNPALMRFHSPDKLSPFGKGGLNSYAYCLGDPVNFTDPSGQVPEWLQPVLTIGLNVGVFVGVGVTGVLTKPTGAALGATRASLIASPLAIVGAGLRLGGVKEGSIVSAVTSTVAIGGTFTQVGISIKNLMSKPNPGKVFRDGIRNLLGFKKKLSASIPGHTVRLSMVMRGNREVSGL